MSTEHDSLAFCEEPSRWERIKTVATVPPSERWGINDSHLNGYSERAGYVGTAFREHVDTPELVSVITRQLDGQEDCVGLDLAGGKNGVALQELVARGIIQKGLFTNYQDWRKSSTKANADSQTHIDGNLLRRDTWSRIIEWADTEAPQGFAVVMHQPGGALQGLSASFYRGAIHQLIDITRPGGIVFTKIPMRLRKDKAVLTEVCGSIKSRDDVERAELTPSGRSAILYRKSS
jgi:hypothetical protein